MPGKKRYNFRKILAAAVWCVIGAATIVLLGAAMNKKDNSRCTSVEITIKGVKNNFFVDKADVYQLLEKNGFTHFKIKPLNSFDLAAMELILKENVWIRSAELYFDNNDALKINITEREPVVRIFNANGASFYIDSSLKKLPLNTKFSARLPVFTNYPVTQNKVLNDNNLLADVKNIGTYILNDPFWMAQIEQIEVTAQHTFEMIPKIGNQTIVFGTADHYIEKFNNLLVFYKTVQSKIGWNKYATINVSYRGQVVAVRREAGDLKSDSLRTMQLLKLLIANAQKQENESIHAIQLEQPPESNSVDFLQAYEPIFADTLALRNYITNEGQVSNAGLKPMPDLPTKALTKPTIQSINSTTTENSNTKLNKKPNTLQLKKAASKRLPKKAEVQVIKQPTPAKEPDNEY